MISSLYLQFEAQVKRTPSAICLQDADQQLTYFEALNCIHNLANKLHAKGIKQNAVIGLYSEKTIESVLCFFALSLLGTTVVTLDVAFPVNMINFILKDANVSWIIKNSNMNFNAFTPEIFLSDLLCFEDKFNQTKLNFNPSFGNNQIAWIVYSSGTTGNPKGIAITHTAIIHSIYTRYKFSDYKINDLVLCCIYFYWEVFRPLFRGACAYVLSDEKLLDFKSYCKIIYQAKISETLWTPSFAQMLLQCLSLDELNQLKSLKRVWLNGEVVARQLTELALDKLPEVNFFNLYSISETFDIAAISLRQQQVSKDGFASIGKPLEGVKTWILDNDGEICPTYKSGELYLSCESLAQGYLNREDLNSQSFITIDKLNQNNRIFRTKDVAYKNEQGEIFILGRNDHIVKLRGYNISLLAIEDTIKRVLPVKECIVDLIGKTAVDNTIVCAISPKNETEFKEKFLLNKETGISLKLQNLLADYLPHYAVPTKFFLMEKIQWNQYSAKLNRKLTAATLKEHNKQDKIVNNSPEEKLREIWHNILNIPLECISNESDFFVLGASSLHLMQYVQQVDKIFNIKFNLSSLYQYADFKSHVEWINTQKTECINDFAAILDDISFNIPVTTAKLSCLNLKNAKKVLITGVTGFLGSHWLAHALTVTSCDYYCLVRAKSTQDGMLRLKQVFKRYSLNASLLDGRIKIITGSLDKFHLGINDHNWDFLVNNIDMILHVGAIVNMLYPYQKLKDVNVEGTKTLLLMATTGFLKPFILISSDAVSNSSTNLKNDSINDLTYGYAQSKWAQEQLVQKISDSHQIPYLIFRLGNLGPSLITGAYNQDDANYLFLQFIKNQKIIPEKFAIEFTPVNKMVEFITNESCNKISNNIYPLTSFNIIKYNQVNAYFVNANFKTLDLSSWMSLLELKEPILKVLWNLNLFKANQYSEFLERDCLTLDNQDLQKSLNILTAQRVTEEQ